MLLVAFFAARRRCCCSSTSARTWCRAGCARWPIAPSRSPRRPRSRSSAPAAATWTGSSAQREIAGDARVRGCVDRGRRCAGRAASCRRSAGRLPTAAPSRHRPRRWWLPARGRTSSRRRTCPMDRLRRLPGLLAIASSRPATTTAAPATTTPTISVNGQEVPLGDRSAPTYLLIRALAFPDVAHAEVRGGRRPACQRPGAPPVSRRDGRRADRRRSRPIGRRERPTAGGAGRLRAAGRCPWRAQRCRCRRYSLFEYRDWTTGMTRHARRLDAD